MVVVLSRRYGGACGRLVARQALLEAAGWSDNKQQPSMTQSLFLPLTFLPSTHAWPPGPSVRVWL